MNREKTIMLLTILLSIESAYALPELNDKKDFIEAEELFIFNQEEFVTPSLMRKEMIGYNYEQSTNYSIEQISAEALVILSNLLFDELLPEDWSISLHYSTEDKNFKVDEEIVINFERKIKL